MPSAPDLVRKAIEEDVFLQEALARGIVNSTGLARWLIEEKGIEGTEEAVATAIRRLEDEGPTSAIRGAREALRRAEVDTHTGLCALVVRRKSGFRDRLVRLLGTLSLENGDVFRVVTGKRNAMVILEEGRLAKAREIFGEGLIEAVHTDLVEFSIVPAKGEPGPNLLGLVVEALAVRGVQVVSANSSDPEQYVLFPVKDRAKALQVLTELLSS